VIYKDANITVTAFPTKHAFPETYGYRFDTADRSIVISGYPSGERRLRSADFFAPLAAGRCPAI